MKVVVFTTFTSSDNAYSLNNVVIDQLHMLKRGGYDPAVIVMEGFRPIGVYAEVELRFLKGSTIGNDGTLPENYLERVKETEDRLFELLKDADICITHDIIYQAAHLIYNLASRQLVERLPKLKWLHWIHSATSHNILCSKNEVRNLIKRPFPHGLICYPNSWDIPRVAQNYKYDLNKVKHVPHPIDVCDYLGFHPYTRELVDKYSMLEADIIILYPIRLDRGKQVQMNIKTAAGIKRNNRSVRLVVADFHSTGGDKVTYRNELKSMAITEGLNDFDVIFTSDFKPETKLSCPREMMRDLFLLSNVYIHPSVSETYSLTTQEAALCGNLLILNYDFPPMLSIYGPSALYYKFSSNVDVLSGLDGVTTTKYDNEKGYFDDLAMSIIYQVENNRVLAMKDKTRKERNIDTVFKKYLEPLFFGRFDEI